MTSRKVYHVTHRPDGQWQGALEGSKKASVVTETKAKAVAQTKDLAKNAPLGQIKIHGEKGKIQTEHTYGADPRRSAG